MPDPTAKGDTSIHKIVEPTPRFGVRYNANLETIQNEDGSKQTRIGGQITIMDKIGTGGFCKVFKCIKNVVRKTVFKGGTEQEERPGTQFLALKIFER